MSGTTRILVDQWVPGTPRPQPRPRAVHKNGKTWMYTPQGPIKEWRASVHSILVPHAETLYDCPLAIQLQFYVPRVATTTPDLDNLIKPVMDVLNELKLWKDDSYVVEVHATKVKDKDNQGVHIVISEFGSND